ncbi:MAG: 2-oxo acid dehydrogenase subunit E2 [Candidatus Methanofastidiosa archaeon]|nr:2-oxo acid dehydrogenase subunit E2 [Candidatus Methanofastidiosa archaeon]
MVTEFRFPDVGEGITEGKVQNWRVKVGDKVNEDQIIGDIETDKAVVEMPAPRSGTVISLLIPEGGMVKVGETMLVIGDEGEKYEGGEPSAPEVPLPAPAPAAEAPEEYKLKLGKATLAMPGVRKLAKEKGLDLEGIPGTGAHGQVTKEDLSKSIKETTRAPEAKLPRVKLNYDLYGHIRHERYDGVREVIGRKLSESMFGSPHAVAMDEADITELWSMREQLKERSAEKGAKLSVLAFVVVAVVNALKEHPTLNAAFNEEEKDMIIKEYHNIGIAVDSPDGLKVPVIKMAQSKDVFQIQSEINELAQKARDRKIDLMDMQGSSFSISNYGSIGGFYGVPIINLGDVAILGLGRAKDLPRVINGAIVPRKVIGLSVSFDHRVNDGAEVARFLNSLIYYLERPALLLTG